MKRRPLIDVRKVETALYQPLIHELLHIAAFLDERSLRKGVEVLGRLYEKQMLQASLDSQREEIIVRLRRGETRARIARSLGYSQAEFIRWLQEQGLSTRELRWERARGKA